MRTCLVLITALMSWQADFIWKVHLDWWHRIKWKWTSSTPINCADANFFAEWLRQILSNISQESIFSIYDQWPQYSRYDQWPHHQVESGTRRLRRPGCWRRTTSNFIFICECSLQAIFVVVFSTSTTNTFQLLCRCASFIYHKQYFLSFFFTNATNIAIFIHMQML